MIIEDNKTTTSSQSLMRALTILELFSTSGSSWGIRDLARQIQSNPATVYRTIYALCKAGYLEKDHLTDRYRLGPKIMLLASAYATQNPISEVARKVFINFSQFFDHNFYLGKLFDDQVVYLTVVEGEGPIRISVSQGVSIELYATALGKILLAYQDEDFISRYLASTKMRAFTKNTITDPKILLESLEVIRKEGYALNIGERHEGIGSIGFPINLVKTKETMAISLAYPQSDIETKNLAVEDLIRLGREIVAEICSRISAFKI
jgi:DNA-binding IclR family transcriptional regulator